MTKDDLITCDYIDKYLRFVTYDDFCRNCRAIKAYYRHIDIRAKRMYKWYIYANVFIDEAKKNLIWQFLNFDEPEFLVRLLQRYHER